jgi:D-glycero-D-manno-heptose 1,7-bisphosphate phosphatase
MKKAIFLDRDGIVNKPIILEGKPYPPFIVKQAFLVNNIKNMIDKWHKEGYLVIVVTNQPDISNHLISQRKVEKINRYLQSMAKFDDLFMCPHNEKDKCNCRKPKIGLFLQAKEKYDIDLEESYMIGDRWKDIEAGRRAGCRTIFVNYNYNEEKPHSCDYMVSSIKDIEEMWDKI